MYSVIWQYQVKVGAEENFKALYNSNGEWVQWFKESPHFIRTDLMRSSESSDVFVTVDWWESKEAYEKFYNSNPKRREAIDSKGENYTLQEKRIGSYEVIEN